MTRPGAIRTTPVVFAVVGCCLAFAPLASAHTCSFRPSTGELEITAVQPPNAGAPPSVSVSADQTGRIEVIETRPRPGFVPEVVQLACTDVEGGSAGPTVTNTDAIRTVGSFPFGVDYLEPGRTVAGEAGSPEIEVYYAGSMGLSVTGSAGGVIEMGADADTGETGANLNAAAEDPDNSDTDVVITGTPSGVGASGGPGDDVISAAGGGNFESPLPFPAQLSGRKSGVQPSGADSLTAGSMPTLLLGLDGADELRGGAADDELFPDVGDDLVDGGPGRDGAMLAGVVAPYPALSVDLRLTGPQETGQGADTFVGIEDLTGGLNRDRLIGSDGPNHIDGSSGRDRIKGLGGDDRLDGKGGDDRMSGGSGRDSLLGRSGDDRLAGGAGNDKCRGGAGRDTESKC